MIRLPKMIAYSPFLLFLGEVGKYRPKDGWQRRIDYSVCL